MYQLDKTDKAILQLLQENARLTHKELSIRLHLTTTPIHERIKRLEKEGYIEKYVALLSKQRVEKALVVYCNVSLKEHARPTIKAFEKEVLQLKEVTECYNVTGNYDYLLKVVVRDMATYQDFIVNKLAVLQNILHTHSSFVLTEVRCSTALALE